MAARTDPCAKALAETGDSAAPTSRIDALMRLARCQIAVGCAPFLTTWLSGESGGSGDLASAAAIGLETVQLARKAIEHARDTLGEDAAADLEERVDLLQAFGELFAALGSDAAAKSAHDKLVDACSPLAMYFDSGDKRLVEAARLWQGAAYRAAGRPERALQVLRPAVTAPNDSRIGLWARIERCRVLADMQEYASAIALAQRLSVRVESWFEADDPQTRKQASDSVRRLRAGLLRRWGAKLRKDGRGKEAQIVEKQAAALSGDGLERSSGDWLPIVDALAGAAAAPIPPEEGGSAPEADESPPARP